MGNIYLVCPVCKVEFVKPVEVEPPEFPICMTCAKRHKYELNKETHK